MTRKLFILFLVFCLPVFFVSCGGQDEETKANVSEESKSEEVNEEGIAVAKEILGTFDNAVAETVELVKEKPEVADVKPQFEAMIDNYKVKMTELNAKYLALREKDIRLFGDCNGYMGENRGKHVFQKNQVLILRYRKSAGAPTCARKRP